MNKLLSSVGAVWFVITLTFLLTKAVPGDPFQNEQPLTKEVLTTLHQYYRLDLPWYAQYLQYIRSVLFLDFGESFQTDRLTVMELIKEGFTISAKIGALSLLLVISLGFFFGFLDAYLINRGISRLIKGLAFAAISIPSYLFAVLLQYIFGLKLQLVPVATWGGFQHFFLPALTLAFYPTTYLSRLLRKNLLIEMERGYIQCARAKGLSRFSLMLKHALPNAVYSSLGYFPHLFATILTGSFIVEKIFAIPGLGQWFVNSVVQRDFPMVLATSLFYCMLFLFFNALIDLLHAVIDPKVRKTA